MGTRESIWSHILDATNVETLKVDGKGSKGDESSEETSKRHNDWAASMSGALGTPMRRAGQTEGDI